MLRTIATRAQSLWLSIRHNERGAVATEYGLLIVLIALAIVAAATALGFAIAGQFSDACGKLGGAKC